MGGAGRGNASPASRITLETRGRNLISRYTSGSDAAGRGLTAPAHP